MSSPRERILAAAVKVFAVDGYVAGSVNDVAEAAGMSRHNLLYYFRTKRELLLAVLDSRDAEADRRLHWLERSSTFTLAEFADGLVELLPELYTDRELMQLYRRLAAEAADPEHPAHDWVAARYHRIRGSTTAMLTAAVGRGELRPDIDPEGLAVALLGAIEGIETQWLVDPAVDWARATAALKLLVEAAVVTSDAPAR